MNRSQRRRAARVASSPIRGKQTHKLRPQTCVVWVPDLPGYVAHLGPEIFQVSSDPDMAYHLTEDQAEDLAMAVRLQVGLRTSIRPYYRPLATATGAGLEASPMVITGITSGALKSD